MKCPKAQGDTSTKKGWKYMGKHSMAHGPVTPKVTFETFWLNFIDFDDLKV